MSKRLTDIAAIACLIIALPTGLVLHTEVHHRFIYDDTFLWTIHEIAGLCLALALILHCLEHKPWFKNYKKIPAKRKRVSTFLLIIASLVMLSGIILMCGSHSHFISIFHFAIAVLFTLTAIGHVAKRWKLFMSVLNKK